MISHLQGYRLPLTQKNSFPGRPCYPDGMQRLWAVWLVLGLSVAQAPQGAVLLRLNDAQNAVVVGAFQGGRFIQAEKLTRLEAQRYLVFGPQGRINQAQGAGGLKNLDICDWNRQTPLTLLERRAVQYPAYALFAPWNPQPRPKKIPNITQALRTDLDGDGRDEVILSANQPGFSINQGQIEGRYAQEEGDYGLVLVRKLLSDTDLRTYVLEATYFEKPFGGTEGMPTVITRRVGAILDLKVWRWDGKQFVRVLEWGCGV